MTTSSKTYELRLSFNSLDSSLTFALKEKVKQYLVSKGWNEFVEGAVDELDIDHEYGLQFDVGEAFTRLGGDASPIMIYKYAIEPLQILKAQLEQEFKKIIVCDIRTMDSSVWQEGWKESFKPFSTTFFNIFPPWIRTLNDQGKNQTTENLPLIIEPGMAFGTGQHETTKVCLAAIESLAKSGELKSCETFLDVGTGTGILAIAAEKLGVREVFATDIDCDAISAAKANAERNGAHVNIVQATIPPSPPAPLAFDVVVANILTVVLERIIPDLARATRLGGTLILSGLLVEHEDHLTNISEKVGLMVVKKGELAGWSSIQFKKIR